MAIGTNLSWIAYELQVGTSLWRRHDLVQFQNWSKVLDSSAQTTRDNVLNFFLLTAVSFDQFSRFLLFVSVSYLAYTLRSAIWSQLNSLVCKPEAYYQRKSSFLGTFSEKKRPITKLSLVCASRILWSIRESACLTYLTALSLIVPKQLFWVLK